MARRRNGRRDQTRRKNDGRLANGQGSVYQKGDKFMFSLTLTPGTREHPGKRRTWTFDTEEEAEAARLEALRLREEGQLLNTSRQTVGAFLDEWIRTEAMNGQLTDRSMRNYEHRIKKAKEHIGHIQLGRLSPQHLRTCYASLLAGGTASSTVASIHGLLHQILKDATRWDLIPSNPAEKVDPPRKKHKEIPTLTGAEVNRLLTETKGDRFHALWTILAMVGLRQGEALGLRWRDIAPNWSVVRIALQMQPVRGKGLILCPLKTERSKRELVLLPSVVEALKEHQARQIEDRLDHPLEWSDQDLIFCTVYGKPLGSSTINKEFKQALAKADIAPMRPHALRHTFITALLNEMGVPMPIVSDVAGHASPAVTMNTYAHVRPMMRAEAIKRMADFVGQEDEK